MDNKLQILLFGPFEIYLHGKSLIQECRFSQQTQSIAKILFSSRGKVVTSEKMIEIVWPKDSVDSARNNLHVRISQLRNGLGEKKSIIQTIHGGYLLQTDETCWLDVEEFQQRCDQGKDYQNTGKQNQAIAAYESARQIYRGDFLAEDIYEDWTFNEREFLRERFLTLLVELSECYAQQGRFRLAIARARHALKQDPLRENIYVRLMLYHYFSGERPQALRLFESCQKILKEELGVTPMDSTSQLVEQIKLGTLWKAPGVQKYPPPIYVGKLFEVPYALLEIPFIGREREYAWLLSQWNDKNKRPILLEGETGVGKSRLIETFTGYLETQGVQVLHVQLSPFKHSPLKALISVLASRLSENIFAKLNPITLASLSRRFPEFNKWVKDIQEQPALSLSDERELFYQSITSLAAAIASQPTLLVIDDAHRLNRTTADLLGELNKSFHLLLSYRSEETPSEHPVRLLFGNNHLCLSPLSDTEINALIQKLSGQDHPEIAEKIAALSNGNPLYLITLLQHMFESGQLYVEKGGNWNLTNQQNPTVPESLHRTIEIRLQNLNREQRLVFDSASVLGGEFEFALLKHINPFDEEHLLRILDELIETGLIFEPRSTTQSEFVISHDCYVEVAYETLPSIRKKNMHLKIAKSIEILFDDQLDNHLSELANHYDKAEKPLEACYFAILAGEQAVSQYAFSEARYFFGRALELLPPERINDLARVRLAREKVFEVQAMRKEEDEELIELEALSPQLSPDQKAEIQLRRAYYAWIVGNDQEAQSAIKAAILKAQSCNDKLILTKALILAGRAALDQELAVDYLQQAQNLSREIDQLGLEGDITRYLGNAFYWQGKFNESRIFFEKALTIHQRVGDLRGELSALNNLAHVLALIGDHRQSIGNYQKAQEICENIGDRLAEGVILTNLGGLTANQGNYQTAQIYLEKATVIRSEIDNDEGLAVAFSHLGKVHRHQGCFDDALQHYDKALQINERIQHQKQTAETLIGLSELYIELGDHQQAQKCLEQSAGLIPEKKSPAFTLFLSNSTLLQYLLKKHKKALSLGEQAHLLCEGLPGLQAAVQKNLGFVLTELNQLDKARELFNQSKEYYHHQGQSHLAIEPLAGLARVSLLQNNLNESADLAGEIYHRMEDGPLQGPDRIFWIYLTCYQVLAHQGDQLARDVLEMAYPLINQRAANISSISLRKTYLTNGASIQEILNIWQTLN